MEGNVAAGGGAQPMLSAARVLYSTDPAHKKRKRWKDGFVVCRGVGDGANRRASLIDEDGKSLSQKRLRAGGPIDLDDEEGEVYKLFGGFHFQFDEIVQAADLPGSNATSSSPADPSPIEREPARAIQKSLFKAPQSGSRAPAPAPASQGAEALSIEDQILRYFSAPAAPTQERASRGEAQRAVGRRAPSRGAVASSAAGCAFDWTQKAQRPNASPKLFRAPKWEGVLADATNATNAGAGAKARTFQPPRQTERPAVPGDAGAPGPSPAAPRPPFCSDWRDLQFRDVAQRTVAIPNRFANAAVYKDTMSRAIVEDVALQLSQLKKKLHFHVKHAAGGRGGNPPQYLNENCRIFTGKESTFLAFQDKPAGAAAMYSMGDVWVIAKRIDALAGPSSGDGAGVRLAKGVWHGVSSDLKLQIECLDGKKPPEHFRENLVALHGPNVQTETQMLEVLAKIGAGTIRNAALLEAIQGRGDIPKLNANSDTSVGMGGGREGGVRGQGMPPSERMGISRRASPI